MATTASREQTSYGIAFPWPQRYAEAASHGLAQPWKGIKVPQAHYSTESHTGVGAVAPKEAHAHTSYLQPCPNGRTKYAGMPEKLITKEIGLLGTSAASTAMADYMLSSLSLIHI